MYALFFLFVIGLTHFVPTLAQNATINNGKRQYTIPDGGRIEIQCLPNNTNTTTTWKIFGKTLGEPINDDLSNFNISENSSLIVTNSRNSSLQGLVNVTCIASSNNTNFSRIIEIVFFKAPKITNTKFIYDVPDDGSTKTTFSCDVTGFPQPEIRWMLGKVTLPTGATYLVNITDVPNANLTASNDGSLEVMSSSRDGGFGVDVVCFANNSDGNTAENFLVRFLKAPKILSTMFDIAIPSELVDYVWIPCQTLGYPRPFIEWVFGNVRINGTSRKVNGIGCIIQNFERIFSSYQVYENGSLLIDNPYCAEQVPHENFTCVASSFLGVDTQSHAFSIGALMTFPFEIILVNASQFGNRAGVVAKFESVFKDGTDSLSLRSMNVTFVNVTSGMVRFVLTWLEQRLKQKNYIVTINTKDHVNTAQLARDVRNKLKENEVDVAYFFIDAKPGPATDLSVKNVAKKEITFSWTKPDYFTVDYYQIQTNDGGGSNWDNRAQAPGDKTSFVLKGLVSGTKYLIRMESVNNKGTGIPSEHVQAKTDDDDSVSVVIIVVVVILVVLVLIAVVLGVLYYRHKPTRDDLVVITMDDNNPYFLSIPGVQTTNIYERDNRTFCPFLGGDLQVSLGADEKEYFSWREIARDSLQMGDTLGQGEFGMVVKAMWTNEEEKKPLPVAVKTIKDNATDTDRKELFKELKLMAEISEHPNIVKMIGACSKGGPLWIIVELCEHGNLLNFLRKNRQEISGNTGDFTSSLDSLLRVRIAFDVAKGMHYLEDKKIVHRDLAARNVLLGKSKIAKIADFGLSRDIYEQGTYEKKTGGKLPVKWMAIESLKDQTYDSKSDVWSYGVLFWEIESAGMVPYPGVGGRDVIGFLLNGFRLDKPSETPFEIYEIMKKCWEPSPKVRPHFKEIESELEAYLEERADYLPVMIDEDQGDHEEAYINYIVGIEDDETPNDTSL